MCNLVDISLLRDEWIYAQSEICAQGYVTVSSLALLMALLWINRSNISSCHLNGIFLQNF